MHLVRASWTLHLLMLLQFLEACQAVGAEAAWHHLRLAVLLAAEHALRERGGRTGAVAVASDRVTVGGREAGYIAAVAQRTKGECTQAV